MAFDQKKYSHDWYLQIKDVVRERSRKRYAQNRASIKARVTFLKKQNPEREATYRRRLRFGVIKQIFDLLGYHCSLCGNDEPRVLQIDHVEGRGRQHFLAAHGSVNRYYRVILDSVEKNEGRFRILCANCNILEGIKKGYRTSVWDFSESFFANLK